MKNWTPCIIASIVCKLLGLAAVLGFVFHMVLFTCILCIMNLFQMLRLNGTTEKIELILII